MSFCFVDFTLKFIELLSFDVVLLAWGCLVVVFALCVRGGLLPLFFMAAVVCLRACVEEYVVGYAQNSGFAKNLVTLFCLKSVVYSLSNPACERQ